MDQTALYPAPRAPRHQPWLVAVCAVVLLAPFLNKAAHIDDTLFLKAAEQILVQPLDPFGFAVNWYGWPMPMHEVTQNPTLACYWLALGLGLFGFSELLLHLWMLPWAVAMALSTYCLAERLCRAPEEPTPTAPAAPLSSPALLASLAALASPLFLINAGSLMCDTLMAALYTWAVYSFIRYLDGRRTAWLILATCCAFLAPTAKYFGVSLAPLLLVYGAVRMRRPGLWLLPALVPLAGLALHDLWMHALYGVYHFLGAVAYTQREHSLVAAVDQFYTALLYLGGALPGVVLFQFLVLPTRVSARTRLTLFLLPLLAGAVAYLVAPQLRELTWFLLTTPGPRLHMALFSLAGTAFLLLALRDLTRPDADGLLLACWFLGTLVFTGLINWTVNGRSLLPLLPVAAAYLARALTRAESSTPALSPVNEDRPPRATPRPLFTGLALTALSLGLALSLLVALADLSQANIQREAVRDIAARLAGADRPVYFQGHWGFQWYMERAGFTHLVTRAPQLAPGDLMVAPFNNTNVQDPNPDVFKLVGKLTYPVRPPVAVQHPYGGAGFYTNFTGPFPYSFLPSGDEGFLVFRFTP